MGEPENQEPERPTNIAEITLEEWVASCQSCCGVEPASNCDSPRIAGETSKQAVESSHVSKAP